MSLFDFINPVGRLAKAAEDCAIQLKRIADAHEGIPVPLTVVPEAEPDPATLAGASSDRDYAQIEGIEQRYLALSGRLPTEDEIERELDGLEIPPEVSAAAIDRHRRVRGLGDEYGPHDI